MQEQIGEQPGSYRQRRPAALPGSSLEPAGNCRPRGMSASLGDARTRGDRTRLTGRLRPFVFSTAPRPPGARAMACTRAALQSRVRGRPQCRSLNGVEAPESCHHRPGSGPLPPASPGTMGPGPSAWKRSFFAAPVPEKQLFSYQQLTDHHQPICPRRRDEGPARCAKSGVGTPGGRWRSRAENRLEITGRSHGPR